MADILPFRRSAPSDSSAIIDLELRLFAIDDELKRLDTERSDYERAEAMRLWVERDEIVAKIDAARHVPDHAE